MKGHGVVWAAVLALLIFLPLFNVNGLPAAEPTPAVIMTSTIAPTQSATTMPTLTPTPRPDGLTPDEAATLGSLQLVNDFPLYTMLYVGEYSEYLHMTAPQPQAAVQFTDVMPAWGCSLFAALGDEQPMLYGRSFDWAYSPALLLYTDPPDGYASVSVVDLAYLTFDDVEDWRTLIDLPLIERQPLLRAPAIPFDGMNSQGLVVGMAAVSSSQTLHDPEKPDVASVTVMRMLLDHAATVDEALMLMDQVNILWSGGPALHFLIADAGGQAALVEFREGETVVMENADPWHLATNFLVYAAGSDTGGVCLRYDLIEDVLQANAGALTPAQGMELLESVSVSGTQWSTVYEIERSVVTLVVGRRYDEPYRTSFDLLAR